MTAELELAGWRRVVSEMYAALRADTDPERAHARWRRRRDELMRSHPQSPLPEADPLRATGLAYWPYDPDLRYALPLLPAGPASLSVRTDADGAIELRRVGAVQLPAPLSATLDVWWLRQYGGGIFIPVRDGTAGDTSYGGGRYLIDSAKGADLGGTPEALVIDLNFLYHPSCRYNSAWQCPLAPRGNTIAAPVTAGEHL